MKSLQSCSGRKKAKHSGAWPVISTLVRSRQEGQEFNIITFSYTGSHRTLCPSNRTPEVKTISCRHKLQAHWPLSEVRHCLPSGKHFQSLHCAAHKHQTLLSFWLRWEFATHPTRVLGLGLSCLSLFDIWISGILYQHLETSFLSSSRI